MSGHLSPQRRRQHLLRTIPDNLIQQRPARRVGLGRVLNYLEHEGVPFRTSAPTPVLIRTATDFRSSSGRCAHSRHPAEDHPQVLIIAPAAPDLPDFVIPAGTAAAQQRAYPGIPAGSVCTVTETVDGHTATVLVTVTGNGQQVTVPSGGSIVVTLSDNYTFAPGSLVVSKTITGVAAGDQGEVSISVSCPGTSFDPFVIPAGQAAGTLTQEFGPIPADTACTVTETANGNNAVVDVIVQGNAQTVTIPPGGFATAELIDTYRFAPGSLTVTKTITGPAAGQQGDVTLTVTCDGELIQPTLTFPAGDGRGRLSVHLAQHPHPGDLHHRRRPRRQHRHGHCGQGAQRSAGDHRPG